MKEHLSVEQIRKYGERQLPPGDVPLVVTHLDVCSACFAIMRDLFPQRTDPERAVAISFGETTTSDDDDEPWHLDFDAHLQRFVDGKFDEVEGEVIASHLSVCPDCAQAVRELREFKDSLRLRQLEREALNRPGHTPAAPNADRRHRVRDWWRRMSAPSTLHLVLAMSLLVALIIGGFFWLRSGTRVAPVVSQQSQPTPANHSPLIVQQGEPGKRPAASDSQTPSPTPATSPAGLKTTPAVLLDDGAAQIGLNSLGQLTGLDNLPRAVQETVAQTLRSEALPLPEVLAKLAPAAIQTRGPASVMIANDQLSPAWQVIKSDRPSFHWPAGVAGAQYEVTVFDERFNPISQSQPVSETSWQPDRPLPRGRTLNWQVKISPHKGATGRSTEPVAQAKFSILSQSALDKVEIVDRLSTSSHLVRGITYAQAGLLVEAEREFHILLQQNPESLLVKKLLTQVSKKLGRD